MIARAPLQIRRPSLVERYPFSVTADEGAIGKRVMIRCEGFVGDGLALHQRFPILATRDKKQVASRQEYDEIALNLQVVLGPDLLQEDQ